MMKTFAALVAVQILALAAAGGIGALYAEAHRSSLAEGYAAAMAD